MSALKFAFRSLLLFWFVVLTTGADTGADDAPSASEGELIFAHSVLPILKTKCLVCHGSDPNDVRGELSLRSFEDALRGGESGEASLVPGKPEASSLYLAATREGDWPAMPPKENDALDSKQLAALHRWISLGAPWPNDERVEAIKSKGDARWDREEGLRVATSGGLDVDWTNRRYKPEDLWAYRPLSRTDVPEYIANPSEAVDWFINERLDQLRLISAPPADRRTLIRRITFDLIGLPPTPGEVVAFVNDPESDDAAFAKVVERLLASEHYGERWAQHWLDVTRYADSSGFANDFERGSAWRYRDYVVRSFNSDKPYDEFVREQIAGDEIDPSDPEKLIAVGFLRMGPWELTGMEVPKVARQRFLDDATDAIGQVFLGQMLQCARCHDHKFDPVPTRDYYAIQATLATTQLAERAADFLPTENTSGFDEEIALWRERGRFYDAQLERLDQQRVLAARAWYASKQLDGAKFERELKASGGNFDVTRSRLLKANVPESEVPPKHVGFEPVDFGMERVARKGKSRLSWVYDRYQPFALSVYNGYTRKVSSVESPVRVPSDLREGELEQPAILVGGDPFSPGESVTPGVLSAVVGLGLSGAAKENRLPSELVGLRQPRSDKNAIGGQRTALADWMVSPANPLTPRVIVNRIWLGHFGQAIAGNPNNFGATGKKPTHPQLLDWLAHEFLAHGQSIKHLHRVIVMSDTYRRSSSHPEPESLDALDPLRESYAVFRPRRLSAEEIRDSMLAVSGELNRTIGGIPVRPEIHLEAALQPRMVMGTFAEAWQPSALPRDRHRRTLYALKLRGARDPFLEVFNAPSPDLSTEHRDAATITPQVFFLLNGQAIYARALATAERLDVVHGEDSSAAIRELFLAAMGRDPDPSESEVCLEHWERMIELHQGTQLEPQRFPNEVVREAVEENTGEKFSFTEPLEVTSRFVPDLEPDQVSPRVRALAEVCLVVFNSNEFVYID